MNKKLVVLLIGFIAIAGCKKESKDEVTSQHHSCYNKSLVHDGACTTDCPGFEGCDGEMYCNECEAARKGIGPK